jgi:hypothetical protein
VCGGGLRGGLQSHPRPLPNFADLSQLPPRAPLPPRPARALVFSNSADAHLWAVRAACERHGVPVEAIGAGVGQLAAEPAALLARYDLVFAKGRAAIEALASGAAVILATPRARGRW